MKNKEERLILRTATLDDLEILKYWDRQAHVIESDPNDEWSWETELARNPAWREQLMAEIEGNPIGFVQIIDAEEEESHYWGEIEAGFRALDIWIGEERNLGKGYGTDMMKLAIGRCFEQENVKAILIDPLTSNVKAHRFYERLGFKFLREQQFGEDHCLVYWLEREEWIKSIEK